MLGSAPTLHQLLAVDRRKSVLVGHILAMLSHVLRTRADNVTVVQDILAQRGLVVLNFLLLLLLLLLLSFIH